MNLRKLRRDRKLNQAEFWGRIGVKQSAGSRLENENRPLADPIKILLDLAYGDAETHRKTLKQVRQ